MLFLVDGYNVTRSDPETRHLNIEGQRDALVRRLRARGEVMLGAGRIVVFFDGAEGSGESVSSSSPVTVVFSRAGTADDAIVRMAAGASEKVVVVSNDRGLLQRARVHAKGPFEERPASTCHEDSGTGAARKGKRPAPRRDTGLPPGANKITEELKQMWLDEDDR